MQRWPGSPTSTNNGSKDIAWRASTGALVLWLLDAGNLAMTVDVALDSALVPIGAGDFDGNGVAEIALRNPSGVVYVVHPLIAQATLESTDLANAQFWQRVDEADLDSDGSDELVLAMGGAIRIAGCPAIA
jgi:hypothetical protein